MLALLFLVTGLYDPLSQQDRAFLLVLVILIVLLFVLAIIGLVVSVKAFIINPMQATAKKAVTETGERRKAPYVRAVINNIVLAIF